LHLQEQALFEVSMFTTTSGQGEPPSATDAWTAQRRAARHTDLALTDVTRTWMFRLPLHRRPVRLAAQFPRVANRIALCWGDSELARQVLDDLLEDRRGGRRGFPVLVARELHRLRDFRAARE
jgi:hypothetical protein